MKITNYTWITGKICYRAWGTEYRYTVQNRDGKLIDSIVSIENDEVSEKVISTLITEQLVKIDVEPEDPIDPMELAKDEREEEIRQFLIEKELIGDEETVWDVKSKDEIIADAEVEAREL